MNRARRLARRVRAVPGLGADVLAVAVVSAAGLIAAGFLLPHYDLSAPWSHRYEFSAVVEKAPGMKASSKHPVTIAGIEVGTVRALTARPDGHALITMALEPGYTVYRDARLQVRTLSPINDVYVALEPGNPSAGRLPEHGTVPMSQTSRFIQPAEVLNKLDARTQQAVTDLVTQADIALRDAPRELPSGIDQTDRTLLTIRPVVHALQTRRATIQKLITNLSRIAEAAGTNDERLAALIESLHHTLGVLAARDDQLNRTLLQLPGLRDDLDNAMTSATALTVQLNPTLDALRDASNDLPPTLDKLNRTVERAHTFVRRASPVIDTARPIVSDLRSFVPDANKALGDLRPVTALLPDATVRLVPWLPDLQAFVYQTSSAFSMSDANGGLGRAQLSFELTNPAGGLKPMPDIKPDHGRSGR